MNRECCNHEDFALNIKSQRYLLDSYNTVSFNKGMIVFKFTWIQFVLILLTTLFAFMACIQYGALKSGYYFTQTLTKNDIELQQNLNTQLELLNKAI